MSAINPHYASIKTLDDIADLSPYARASVDILRREMQFDTAHDEGHIVRVVRNALWFGREGDRDIIVTSAVLHDLVNLPKNDPDRKFASARSATKAVQCLEEIIGFDSAEQCINIHHAIEAHSYSADVAPTTIEAMAVQDADRIDALGYIGIARLFATGGAMNRILFDYLDPHADERELDEQKYTLDHFHVKLQGLAATMQTYRGRQQAAKLTDKMEAFIKGLVDEIG